MAYHKHHTPFKAVGSGAAGAAMAAPLLGRCWVNGGRARTRNT